MPGNMGKINAAFIHHELEESVVYAYIVYGTLSFYVAEKGGAPVA